MSNLTDEEKEVLRVAHYFWPNFYDSQGFCKMKSLSHDEGQSLITSCLTMTNILNKKDLCFVASDMATKKLFRFLSLRDDEKWTVPPSSIERSKQSTLQKLFPAPRPQLNREEVSYLVCATLLYPYTYPFSSLEDNDILWQPFFVVSTLLQTFYLSRIKDNSVSKIDIVDMYCHICLLGAEAARRMKDGKCFELTTSSTFL